jgi:zinc transporter ZupT
MVLHKVTSSFAIAQILRSSQYKGWKLAGFGIAYTLISPLALYAVHIPGLERALDSEWILGFSAGLLTYVTLANLVPQARRIIKRRPRTIFGFMLGFLVSLGIGFWHTRLHQNIDLGHDHDHHDQGQNPGSKSGPLP